MTEDDDGYPHYVTQIKDPELAQGLAESEGIAEPDTVTEEPPVEWLESFKIAFYLMIGCVGLILLDTVITWLKVGK